MAASIFLWGDAHPFLEHAVEGALVGKAAVVGDLQNAHGGVAQQIFGMLHPQTVQIAQKGAGQLV